MHAHVLHSTLAEFQGLMFRMRFPNGEISRGTSLSHRATSIQRPNEVVRTEE